MLCKILASSYHFIGMANFDPPFDPPELEYDVHMKNCSGYKTILKNNP